MIAHALFDHSIRTPQDRLRDREAAGFRRVAIDEEGARVHGVGDESDLGGRKHRVVRHWHPARGGEFDDLVTYEADIN